MDEAEQPREPAEPMLASSLLDAEERQRRRFSGNGERLSTGCTLVDEAVLGGGGLERGIVLGISAEGMEGRLLSLNLMASTLLSDNLTLEAKGRPKAAVIDTTGSFPISLLAEVIRSRVSRAKSGTVCEGSDARKARLADHDGINDRDVEEKVRQHLEKVSISRVFDAEGLWEVLGEITRNFRTQLDHEERGDINATHAALQTTVSRATSDMDEESSIKREVMDSEDGSYILDNESKIAIESPEEQADEGIEIVVVDSMTDIINGLLANKETTEAHNMLSTLSTIIHNMSSQSNILTILSNSTISAKSTYLTNLDAPPSRYQMQNSTISLPSVFGSNPLKPALGRIFDQFPSLHIMLSPIPQKRDDAEILFGQNEDIPSNSRIEYCTILEVLKDETPDLGKGRSERRFGQREQRWVPLSISEDELSFKPAFLNQEKGVS